MQISCLGKLRAVWPPRPHAASACCLRHPGPGGLHREEGQKWGWDHWRGGKRETISLSFTHPSNPRHSDSWWGESIVLRGTSVFRSGFFMKKKKKKKKNLNLPLLNRIVRKWPKTKLLPMWSVFYWLLWSDASREHKLQYNIQCTYLAILLMKMPQWTEGFDNVNHVSLTLWQAFYFIF